ncbi:tyrosine-type recombinase/integrase [Desulfogranum marinum]|uniref:tyrosine-type recombinase/integrase n=1 Tax=Desulfogranum marinum TaxID=453220 RepID=UPI001964279D|nr:site-specific integrase [Desulfogranum marinum]MBM9512006.1 site-specific integrase [Desulfogranum marinum]
MSVYSNRNKRWRYDFTLKGIRYTEAGFKTKKEAQRAEAQRREIILNPAPIMELPTDTDFFELVNERLDYVKAYNSERHYKEYLYMARRWAKEWQSYACSEITARMVEQFVLERSKVSHYVANKEIRYLKATFNFGLKKGLISHNPVADISFLPVEKRIKYIPPVEHIDKVIAVADQDTQDYLWTIRETMGRVSEINRLVWDDIDLNDRYITLYTRKKKGGHLTPRRIWMTDKVYEILSARYQRRAGDRPWVFWHRYFSTKTNDWAEGPYKDRKYLMRNLCEKAGVPYFRYHALRHAGASLMDSVNVPIGAIQKILGHENRRTTEIYLHSFSELEKQAVRDYEAARKKSHTFSHTQKTRG